MHSWGPETYVITSTYYYQFFSLSFKRTSEYLVCLCHFLVHSLNCLSHTLSIFNHCFSSHSFFLFTSLFLHTFLSFLFIRSICLSPNSILLYPATTAIAAAASNIIQVAQRIKLIDLDASANFFKVREAAGRKCDAIRIDESSSERSSHEYCYTAVLFCPVLSATFSLSLSLTVYLSLSLSLFVSLPLCLSLSLSLCPSLSLSLSLSLPLCLSVCLSLARSLSVSYDLIWYYLLISDLQ